VTVEAAPGGHRIRVRIPSKINLFLSVRGTRPDGYHELVSVMQTVTLHDTVVAQLDDDPVSAHPAARRLMALAFSLDGPATVPPDEDNLAVRAARSLMDALGHRHGGGHLQRRGAAHAPAPAQGHPGRGGDGRRVRRRRCDPAGAQPPVGGRARPRGAARARRRARRRRAVLRHRWDGARDRDGDRNGADPDARHLPLGGRRVGPAAVDPGGLPRVRRGRAPSQVEPDLVLQALRTGDAEALGAALYNDLEVAATHLRPQLAGQREALREAGALGVLISGSGPTVLGLAGSAQHAASSRSACATGFDRVEVAQSPAGGPELLSG
jgi:4-diphosphocytidyl-2-C-methyl-D-erythritol kinase